MSDLYDPRYLTGIAYFNDARFFQAHEQWEEVWMECNGVARKFYQGLIQVAVCLHHFRNGNTRGTRKLFHSSSDYLRAYLPWYLGIDLQRLLADLLRCCEAVLASDESTPKVRLDPELLPRIHFAETCDSGDAG